MKTGIYTNAFREYPFEVAAKKIRDAGIDMIELGCGEESGFAHCNPEELLEVKAGWTRFVAVLPTTVWKFPRCPATVIPYPPMRQQGNSVFAP